MKKVVAKILFSLVWIVGSALVVSNQAYADGEQGNAGNNKPPVLELDESPIGAAGTLIGASLEYAGHYLQSQFLDVLARGLETSLGGFLFTLGAITGIFLIAIGGQYKFGLWFLVGPPIFYSMIHIRTPSTGVSWQNGERVHDFRKVQNASSEVRGEDRVRVSTFFAWWDWFSSGVVQNFTKALKVATEDVQSDLHLLQTAQKYGGLWGLNVQQKELKNFVNLVMLHPTCVNLYGLMFIDSRRIAGPPDGDTKNAKAMIERLKGEKVVNSGDKKWDYVKAVFSDAKLDEILGRNGAASGLSCMDLWELAVIGLEDHAMELVQVLVPDKNLDPANSDDLVVQSEQVLRKLASKFGEKEEEVEVVGEDGKKKTEKRPLSPEERVHYMLRAIAGRMMLNAMKERDPSMAKFFLRDPLKTKAPAGVDPAPISAEIRKLNEASESRGKGEFLSTMLALPYMQGVAFYFLAMSFPFFCFALLVPGRHHVFLLWMGLWFWLKLWDFGFAVVMLFDEVLYNLLPRSPGLTKEELSNPSQVFQMLLQEDPMYSVHVYYNLLATLIASVPVLTGIIIKKGGGEVLDAVSQGVRAFSGRIGGSMEAYTRGAMASEAIRRAMFKEREIGERVQARILASEEFQNLSEKYRNYMTASQGGALGWLNSAVDKIPDAMPGKGTFKSLVGKGVNVGEGVSDAYNKANAEYYKKLANSYYAAEWRREMWNAVSLDPEIRGLLQDAVMFGNANHRLFERYWMTLKEPMSTDMVIAQAKYGMGLEKFGGNVGKPIRDQAVGVINQGLGKVIPK